MSKTKKTFKILGGVVLSIFIFLCCVLIFFNVTHEYHNVSGQSMYPTLNAQGVDSDAVFVSKIKKCKRGDVIVAKSQKADAQGNDYIVVKRLIALGGDKVCIKAFEGNIRIFIIKNGQDQAELLEEPYLANYNVNNGLDTRFYKMATNFSLEVDLEGFVTIPLNTIFYLGDNRINSYDCSAENYGPVNKDLLVGKVDYIITGKEWAYFQVLKQFLGA